MVKVKQEKMDPEVDGKIEKTGTKIKEEVTSRVDEMSSINVGANEPVKNAGHPDSSLHADAQSTAIEDKKSIQPAKSSSEILAELFQVFNAAPPKVLLGNSDLPKKHKKRKKEKKRHSKSEEHSESDTSMTQDSGRERSIETKHKNKKKKKNKHKEREKQEKSKKKKSKSVVREVENSKESESKKTKTTHVSTKQEPDEQKSSRNSGSLKRRADDSGINDEHVTPAKRSDDRYRQSDHKSSYNGSRDRNDRKCDYHKIKIEVTNSIIQQGNERGGHTSDISLSDEETYLKERERVSDNNRYRFSYETSNSRHRNRFYAGVERSRGRPRRHRERSNSCSRSRSRSRSLGIDKKRLLEIARKNAISMFKRGNLPGCDAMTEEVKDKVLLKMRYGGRTVQDLTDFCKKISNGEQLSELSTDEDSDVDNNGNAKAFHHPFQLKDREPIVMHIRNATPIVPRKTENMTKAITMQFPVSSGQHHRLTEAWVPVEKKEMPAQLLKLPAATQQTNIFKPGVPKNVFEKTLPQAEEQEPAFKPVTLPNAAPSANEMPTTSPQTATPLNPGNIATPPDMAVVPTPNKYVVNYLTQPFVPEVPVPSAAPTESVFPDVMEKNLDVSSIISKRLNAMRRLQENPMDSEAIKMMYNSQKEMSSWVSSKHMPGQFTGTTGVNVLKVHELNSGPQVWARRDQLTSTQPVSGGMGMQLLQKMGWKPGEGLGREKTGSLQPLLLDVKLDKRGLVSKEENGYRRQPQYIKKQRPQNVAQAQQDMQSKHPVCLLNELTSKRKWTPPLYTLIDETGPSHSKTFMFSVSINGQAYSPNQASQTKKEAKVLAARYCLQQLGVLPL